MSVRAALCHAPLLASATRRRLRRAGVGALSALTLSLGAGAGLVALAPGAGASASDEYGFLGHLNGLRAAHGLGSLSLAWDLTSLARQHSQAMATQQQIFHNGALTSAVSNWQVVGENVGMGPSVGGLDQAFDNSPEHYANEVNGAYTQVGIGAVTDSRGEIFVTLDFRQPMSGSTPVSAPAPAPARTPAVQAPPAAPTPAAVAATGVPAHAAAPARSAAPAPSAAAPLGHAVAAPAAVQRPVHLPKVVGTDPVAHAMSFADALATLS